MEFFHHLLNDLVDISILYFEFFGVFVLVLTGVRGAISYIRRSPFTRLDLAKGMAMGLEFKLGSEILRTVIVRDIEEIATVAGIILLRAALTFLIHWEIKNEESSSEVHGHHIKKHDNDVESKKYDE